MLPGNNGPRPLGTSSMQVLYVSHHLLPTQPCDLTTIPLAPRDWEGDRAGLREQTAHEASQQLNWSSNKVAWLKT